MGPVMAVVTLFFLLFVILGVYATVKVVGAARRRVDETLTRARSTVEDHALRARSSVRSGAAGELARLRLRLRTSMRATQETLRTGVRDDQSLTEPLGLFDRLSAHARALDEELRHLESEPDRTTLGTRLPGLRERTDRIVAASDSLRWAARDRAGRFAEDDLDVLGAQIDVETGALRHWETTEPTAPGSTAASAAENGEEDGKGVGRTRASNARRQPAEETTTPAIDRSVQPRTYSWQKEPRPQNTT